MKTVIFCIFFLCASIYAFPATSDDDSSESEFFRPLNKKVVEVDGVSESEEDPFYLPSFFRPVFFNPFAHFGFGGFPNLFPTNMFRWNGLFDVFKGIPEDAKETGTTSDVKVIDGKRVTVNVTTYERNGVVFKYKVVEIVDDKPEGEATDKSEEIPTNKPEVTTSEETMTKGSDEATTLKNDNNSLDNEIFREEVSPPDQNDDLIA